MSVGISFCVRKACIIITQKISELRKSIGFMNSSTQMPLARNYSFNIASF